VVTWSYLAGTKIRAELEALKAEFHCIREVRGMGVLLGVEFGKPIAESPYFEKWGELGAAMKKTALANKLIIRADHSGWFAVAPALCATDEEIEELCQLIRKSLVEALELVEA
jgi:4-aminobutyrate aminotransferase-like enzyme